MILRSVFEVDATRCDNLPFRLVVPVVLGGGVRMPEFDAFPEAMTARGNFVGVVPFDSTIVGLCRFVGEATRRFRAFSASEQLFSIFVDCSASIVVAPKPSVETDCLFFPVVNGALIGGSRFEPRPEAKF